jgi:RNA polymerase sigma-70 factor (ECF subfamily)
VAAQFTTPPVAVANFAHVPDEELVSRILAGDTVLFEIIMRRHNQLLYRVARSILRNDTEAEDVMQDAYVRAYEHLNQFAGRSEFRTWLTRIAIHEALARTRRAKRFDSPAADDAEGDFMDMFASPARSPEQEVADAEMRSLLEQSILALPDPYRCVYMLRDVEQMSIDEVSHVLDLSESTVKVRLHRARRALRKVIMERTGEQALSAFAFEAPRCNRVVARVFERIAAAAGQ